MNKKLLFLSDKMICQFKFGAIETAFEGYTLEVYTGWKYNHFQRVKIKIWAVSYPQRYPNCLRLPHVSQGTSDSLYETLLSVALLLPLLRSMLRLCFGTAQRKPSNISFIELGLFLRSLLSFWDSVPLKAGIVRAGSGEYKKESVKEIIMLKWMLMYLPPPVFNVNVHVFPT